MKSHIFFDLDGTILDIRNRFYCLYSDCLQLYGGTPIIKDQYWQLKQAKTNELDILRVSGDENVFPSYEKNRLDRMESIPYLQMDEVWEGFENYLQLLQPRFDLSIVTLRKSSEALKWQIDHLGLRKFFVNIISPANGKFESIRFDTKVNMVREVFGEENLNGWFIGDTEVDILAGKALGVNTCAVGFGLRNVEIMNNLDPDRIAESPINLYQFFDELLTQ
jgi:phosphoglycolate phosphatase